MIFAWKGTVGYSLSQHEIFFKEGVYVVCDNGKSEGVFSELPERYQNIPVTDYGDALILPGMTDLHLHAPQYAFRGIRMDLEVVDWLNAYVFPHESRYSDPQYANKAYAMFAGDLKRSVTTRACVFGTISGETTQILMSLLDKTGLHTLVGKVNTDRNAPEYLTEPDAQASCEDTRKFLKQVRGVYQNSKPILTPRCTYFCSDALMEGLKEIQREYAIPVQSHLSENPRRLEQLRALYPNQSCDGEAYDRFELFGTHTHAIMAHCVHSPKQEIKLMAQRDVYAAHCPESNLNLSSGIAPVRRLLEAGVKTGLGSDIAAGTQLSLLYIMGLAIQVSKMYWRYVDNGAKPLTVEEVFYMATIVGGSVFGKVGSFEPGFEFDAVVLSDNKIISPLRLSPIERLERMLYLYPQVCLLAKCVAGRHISLT